MLTNREGWQLSLGWQWYVIPNQLPHGNTPYVYDTLLDSHVLCPRTADKTSSCLVGYLESYNCGRCTCPVPRPFSRSRVSLVSRTLSLMSLAQMSTLAFTTTPSAGKADVRRVGEEDIMNTTELVWSFHLLAHYLNCVNILSFFLLASHHVFWIDLMNCVVWVSRFVLWAFLICGRALLLR